MTRLPATPEELHAAEHEASEAAVAWFKACDRYMRAQAKFQVAKTDRAKDRMHRAYIKRIDAGRRMRAAVSAYTQIRPTP